MRRDREQRRDIEDLNEEEEPNSVELVLFFWVESSSTVNDDHNVDEKCSRRDAYYYDSEYHYPSVAVGILCEIFVKDTTTFRIEHIYGSNNWLMSY